MYVNLTLKNAKKSLKDYLIYFSTIVLSSGLFYAFLSMSSNSYSISMDKYLDLGMFSKMIQMVSYIITGALAILIFYVNSYMVKRRYKEFGTYMLLGMEQKTVAFMFFMEAFIIAIIGVFCGIILGTVLSQVLTIIVLLTAKQEVVFQFKIYFDTTLQTFSFFSFMFIVIGFLNIRKLSKVKLIDMMNQTKKTDFKFKRKPYVYIGSFIMGILSYVVSTGIFIFIYTSLADKKNISLTIVILGFLLFIIGTYLLFYSASYILIFLKEKSIGFKYKGTNLFLIGSIGAKIKTSPMIIATIAITLTLGMISAIASLILSEYSIGYLNYRLPFDFVMENKIIEIDGKFKKIDIPYEELIKELEKEPYMGSNFLKINSYMINDNSEYKKQIGMKLSDFNKLREMAGHKKIKLEDGTYALQWGAYDTDEYIENYLKHTSSIEINNKDISIDRDKIYKESLGEYLYGSREMDSIIYVLNDKDIEGAKIIKEALYSNLSEEVSSDEGEKLEYDIARNLFLEQNNELIKLIESKNDKVRFLPAVRIKTVEKNEILNASLGMRVIGLYIGAVLFMVSLTILGLKQIMESIEHKDRFKILSKLGVEDSEIDKIILKQIAIYFGATLIIALFGTIMFIISFSSLYTVRIKIFIGTATFIFYMVVAVLMMIFIYISYFIMTYKTFKRNIST